MGAIEVALGMLALAGVLCGARLVRGPSLPDRIVALDALLVIVVTAVAADAARTGRGVFLDVVVVTALLGFVGTSVVARFIERRGG